MAAFVRHELGSGANQVVVIGTDSPTLPVALIEAAFEALNAADVVLGPATDGGYYLLGCAGQVPPVFAGIRWGEPTVLAETVMRLSEPRWRLKILPVWSDVDTLNDWHALRGYLAALRRAGIDSELPCTEALTARACPEPRRRGE